MGQIEAARGAVLLDGTLVSVWRYEHKLFARLAHRDPGGRYLFFNLGFLDPVLIREINAGQLELRATGWAASRRSGTSSGSSSSANSGSPRSPRSPTS